MTAEAIAPKNIFNNLNAVVIDQNKIDDKGKFKYLSWTWAWQEFTKRYPNSTYKFSDHTWPDGTMEVRVKMKVCDGDQVVKRNMWLAVMDYRNEAIVKPNATQINKAKMRCLVKCIAMYGLGLYIYAGEDLPDAAQDSPGYHVDVEKIKAADTIKALQTTFTEAYKNHTGNAAAIKAITAAKDQKKKELAQ